MRAGGPRRRRAAGFTLIELTVSMALMALILVAAYLCMNAGFSAQRLMEPRLEAAQSARVALALMTADFRAACPLAKDAVFIGLNRMMGEVEADNVDFATLNHTPRRAGEGDFCQTSYFLDQDRESGGFVLWRRRNPRLGLDPFSGGVREDIARGVRQLKLEYYDGFDWHDTWGDPAGRGREPTSNRLQPNLSGLPEAVRITLAFATDERTVKAGDQPAGDSGQTREPPMVFQTVARIHGAAATPAGGTAAASESGGPPN